jgi:hypothetical protein
MSISQHTLIGPIKPFIEPMRNRVDIAIQYRTLNPNKRLNRNLRFNKHHELEMGHKS